MKKKNNVFFTSDPHWGHFNVIKYCNRPFQSVEQMDNKLIADWNKVVGKNDIVYVLGDFTMLRMTSYQEVLDIIDQLNGTIHLVYGNHDHRQMWEAIAKLRPQRVVLEGDRIEIKVEGQDIALCHYAHQVWNRSHHGAFHLFGHSHNNLPGLGKSMDVGVDAKYSTHYNWAPFSFAEVKAILDEKEIFGGVSD